MTKDDCVPDHLIRLRGGWQLLEDEPAASSPAWVRLPTVWPSGPSRRIRLARNFGQPPINAALETLWLRLDRVRGLDAVILNGVDVRPPGGNSERLELPLRELNERNELIVEATLPEMNAAGANALADWGEIALVVRQSGAED